MGRRSKDAEPEPGESTGQVVALPGPLAPWRLALVVAIAAVTTGKPLLSAAQSGVGLDMALLRSFGIAFLAWVALGRINRVLGEAALGKLHEPTRHLAAVPDLQGDSSPAPAGDHEDSGRAA